MTWKCRRYSILLLLSPETSLISNLKPHVTVTHNSEDQEVSSHCLAIPLNQNESNSPLPDFWTPLVTVLCGLGCPWEQLLSRGLCWWMGECWKHFEEQEAHREEPYIGVAAAITSRWPCPIHWNLIFKSLLRHRGGRAPESQPHHTLGKYWSQRWKGPEEY